MYTSARVSALGTVQTPWQVERGAVILRGVSKLAERIIEHYERHATDWDADRRRGVPTSGPPVEHGWLDRFTALLPPGGTSLDLGCGGGIPLAKYLVEHGFAVTGVDSAPTLIALCKRRFPKAEWLLADMRTLQLATTFNGLIAWDSFFHLPHDDQRAMFAVFARHAERGTALLFTSGVGHGEAIGSYGGEPLYHASLAPDEYRCLLATHGFTVIDHVVEDPICAGRTVWLAKAEDSSDP